MFMAVNVCVYLSLFGLYVIDYFELEPPRFFDGVSLKTSAELSVMSLDISLYVLLGVGFVTYGLMFWRRLQSSKSSTVLLKVLLLTGLVTVCFVIRCVIIICNVIIPSWNDLWFFDGLYFGCFELLPLCLSLIIIHYRVDHASNTVASVHFLYFALWFFVYLFVSISIRRREKDSSIPTKTSQRTGTRHRDSSSNEKTVANEHQSPHHIDAHNMFDFLRRQQQVRP
jgi:hypothetical protein